MTQPNVPPRPTDDALEAALRREQLLPLPAGLQERILAGLPPRERSRRPEAARPPVTRPMARPTFSLPALARLAAGVLIVLGAWIVAFGAAPTVASAQAPAPLQAVLEPAGDFVPATGLELPTLPAGVQETGACGALWMGVFGIGLLALGLLVALRLHRRPAPSSSPSSSPLSPPDASEAHP